MNPPESKESHAYMTGHRQRIRDKFAQHGETSFFDYELLEIFLTYAIPRRDVKPLANALIERFHSLRDVFSAPLPELEKFPGLGRNSAILIKLSGAIGERILRRGLEDCDYMDHPEKFCAYARRHLSDYEHEVLMVFSLNAQNRLLDVQTVSEGGIDTVNVDPGALARAALLAGAKSVVICHNHPGGAVHPSVQDDAITRDLRRLLERLNLILLDHIIVSRYDYYSYRETDSARPVTVRFLAPYANLNKPKG